MLKNSLKLALKVLARRKVFTVISLVGISLTLVVLMIATAIIDNILAPRTPQSRLDRILTVLSVGKHGPNVSMTSNGGRAFLRPVLRDLPGAEAVALTTELKTIVVYDGQRRLELPLRRTDANYWRILDFHFLEGAPFTAADEEAGRFVVVMTDETAQRLFGTPHAAGRDVNIGGQIYRVVGVVPSVGVAQAIAFSTLWTPLGLGSSEERTAFFGDLPGIVLAKSKAYIPGMQREFKSRVRRMPIDDPKTFNEIRSDLDTTFEAMARILTFNKFGEKGPMVMGMLLAVMAMLFMALPALNLVTLNLSRIMERASEVGVRKAFGAPQRSLIGQFVMENVVLTVIGGAVAFVLAYFILQELTRIELLPGVRFDLNLHVFAWGMATAAFFGVFSGLYPAWKMSRLNVVNALRGGAL